MAKQGDIYKLDGSTRGTKVEVDSIDVHKGTVTFHDTKSGKSSTVKVETFEKNYSPVEQPKKRGKAPAKSKKSATELMKEVGAEIDALAAAKDRVVEFEAKKAKKSPPEPAGSPRPDYKSKARGKAAAAVQTGPTLRAVPEKLHVDTYIRVAGKRPNVVSAKQNGRVRIFRERCDAEQAKEIVAQLGAIRDYLMSEFKLDEDCIKEYIESTLA